MVITFISGFFASMAHVVTGPDHLAAVTPLAIHSRNKSWLVGLSWGVGHTLGMLLIGLLFVIFKELFPLEFVSAYSEFVVGILLILIGAYAIARTYIRHDHGLKSHPHIHTHPHLFAHIHKHDHDHSPEHLHEHISTVKPGVLTALTVGVIHGFAGFSHFVALLPSLALPTVGETAIYLIAFALGTILSMVIFSTIMGLISAYTASTEKAGFLRWFTYAGGVLAIGVGIWWLIQPL